MPNNGGVTRAQYDLMVAAFREKPGTWEHAGRAGGVAPRTAKVAWETGWPSLGNGWAKPIRDLLAAEQTDARAEAVLAAARAQQVAQVPQDETERARAKLAAVQWAVREGELAHGAIVNAGGLLQIVNALLQAAVPLASQVKAAIAKEGPPLGARAGAQLLKEIGAFTRDAGAAARDAVELERLHLGQPGQIVGVTDAAKPMTFAEAEREIEDGMRALERARRRGRETSPGTELLDAAPAATGSPIGTDPNSTGATRIG